MLQRIFQGGNQSLIFGEIVGLMTEIFAQSGDFSSRFVLHYHAVTGGTRIAAGPSVAVGD